jgi:hypothetical protein
VDENMLRRCEERREEMEKNATFEGADYPA